MKTQLVALFLGLTLSQASFATGGMFCKAETNSGKKIEIYACIPHSIPGLCSDITVMVNDKVLFEAKKEHTPAFYVSGNFLGLTAMDEQYSDFLISLEYFGAKNKKNSLIINAPTGEKFKFKDITCELE
jgi:hypothetical protein